MKWFFSLFRRKPDPQKERIDTLHKQLKAIVDGIPGAKDAEQCKDLDALEEEIEKTASQGRQAIRNSRHEF